MDNDIEFGNGEVVVLTEDSQRREAYIPSGNVQNHASNVFPMPGGDLLCTWFSGTQEGMSDISVYLSRLKAGETTWSVPDKLSGNPERSEQNPVLFLTPREDELWLMWTAQPSGHQDESLVMRRISIDGGYTWGEEENFIGRPGLLSVSLSLSWPMGTGSCLFFTVFPRPERIGRVIMTTVRSSSPPMRGKAGTR